MRMWIMIYPVSKNWAYTDVNLNTPTEYDMNNKFKDD